MTMQQQRQNELDKQGQAAGWNNLQYTFKGTQETPSNVQQMPSEADVQAEFLKRDGDLYRTPLSTTPLAAIVASKQVANPYGLPPIPRTNGLDDFGNILFTQQNQTGSIAATNTPTVVPQNGQPYSGAPMANTPAFPMYYPPGMQNNTPGEYAAVATQGIPLANAANGVMTTVPPPINPSDPHGWIAKAMAMMPTNPNAGTTPTTTDPTNPAAQTAANDRLPYFDLIKTIDGAALLRNMMQGPPPSMQNPITHLPRVHYDRTIFDTQRQQVAESSNRAQYEARQQLGQAGDFQQMMLGVNAQQQQAGQQIGLQERDMRMQELNQNAQISGQEQTMQDQQNLQEQTMNYQIQQEAQMRKDAAVQHQLGNIKTDVQQETQYNITKQAIDKQAAIDETHKYQQQKIQLMGLGMQAEENWKNSAEYAAGKNAAILGHMDETNDATYQEMLNDPKWADQLQASGVTRFNMADLADVGTAISKADTYVSGMEKEISKTQETLDVMSKNMEQMQADLAKLEPGTAQYEQKQAQIAGLQPDIDNYTNNLTKYQTAIDETLTQKGTYETKQEVLKELYKRFSTSFNATGAAANYEKEARKNSEYLKRIQELEAMLNPPPPKK
jgi:hypothetical protein